VRKISKNSQGQIKISLFSAEGVVCSDGVCQKQSDIDAKVAKAKELIVQKRKEKEEEEAKVGLIQKINFAISPKITK
jgi:hypothetical protein